jgi:hypothetical protein
VRKRDSKKRLDALVELRNIGVNKAQFSPEGELLAIEFFNPKELAEMRTFEKMTHALTNSQEAIDELSNLRARVINAKTPEEREHWQNQLLRAEADSIVYQSS